MYTSDPDRQKSSARILTVYAGVTLFCILFSTVYEYFSHGVYSADMVFLFAYPAIGGLLPFTVLRLAERVPYPGDGARAAWHCGIAALAVRSCLSGVLEIFGTDSAYVPFLLPVGIALLLGALIGWYARAGK